MLYVTSSNGGGTAAFRLKLPPSNLTNVNIQFLTQFSSGRNNLMQLLILESVRVNTFRPEEAFSSGQNSK